MKTTSKKLRIILRDKNPADAWEDYSWETDPELARLDAAPTVNISYSEYLNDFMYDFHIPRTTSRQFAVDTPGGVHIGNCSYYNLDRYRDEAEMGIMIGNREYWNRGYGVDIITALLKIIFKETGVKRVHLKTLDWNIRAQKCFNKCGFRPCGTINRDKSTFLKMEIMREEWEQRLENGGQSVI